jgi:hypothetical protein
VWQKVYHELKDEGFMVITVAMDSRGAKSARGPIKRAKATHPSLIDTGHLVADLYNMVNVPQAVWIDEGGKIVRPTEVSGAALSFNVAKMRRLRKIYLDAIRDWVHHGESSDYVFDEEQARAHLPAFTEEIALAHANFHLGQTLWDAGNKKEGAIFLRRAVELNPDSWNFFRQMKNLENILGSGGPEFMMRARKYRKAGNEYYPRPDMPGMSKA